MTALAQGSAWLLRRFSPELFRLVQRLRSIYYLLDHSIQRRIITLQILIIVSLVFKMLATLSAIPFLMAVINEDISVIPGLSALLVFLDLQEHHEIILFLGFGSFLLMLLSNLVFTLSTVKIARLNIQVRIDFFRKLFDYYLDEGYEFHSMKNSAMLVHNTSNKLVQAINGIIQSILSLNSSLILFLVSIGIMVLINPLFASMGVVIVSSLLLLSVKYSKRYARQLNREVVRKSSDINTKLMESIRLHEDLTLVGRKRGVSSQLSQLNTQVAHKQMKLQVINLLFPISVEMIIYGTAILLITGFSYFSTQLNLVANIAAFTLILFRLKPHINSVFTSYMRILNGLSNFDFIGADLTASLQHTPHPRELRRLPFKSSINLINVDYYYPGVTEPALSQVSLAIKCGQHIGFCGPSGSGKSTLLKLVLGFVRPCSGKIMVDDQELAQDNVLQWYNIVGYVSQTSRFTDGTLADNILLGRKRNDVANERIWECLEMVQLKDFVSSLAAGIDTLVGEDGIQLSGGQQQRLMIARALYADPEILIFDEATSALDYEVEANIMACIKEIFKSKTVLMVAHRISTIADSDHLYFIEDGMIKESGNYSELMEESAAFNALVTASQLEASVEVAADMQTPAEPR